MAVIVKVQARWEGFQGAPGYTNWYGLSDGDAAAAANALAPRMRTFFNAIVAGIPQDANVKVQRLYQVIDGLTGRIQQEASLTADPAVVTGGGTGVYAGPAGAVVNWETGLFNSAGHRIRGRSYIVPLNGTAYENDGSISPTFLTSLQAAATAAVGGLGGLVVWSRPTTKGGSDGVARTVSAAVVHDRVCILRSRRD